MDNGQLPAYKKQFLWEMDILRQQQLEAQGQELSSMIPQQQISPSRAENNIINPSMYSGSNWRKNVNATSYGINHDLSHHSLNLLVNPQIAKKQHNIQLTPISQYSNATHNKTVFINPKSTSC